MGVILILFLIGVTPLLSLAVQKARFRDSKTPPTFLVGLTIILILALWFPLVLSPSIAWDFPGFYIAASVPIHSVHDHAVALEFAKTHLRSTGVTYFPPYMRPAAFALLLKPLAFLSYWPAFWFWCALCFGAYFTLSVFLYRTLNLPIFALYSFAAFGPAIFGTMQGQDAAPVAMAIGLGVVLLLRNRSTAAGIVFGICCYKFNLILGIPVALALHRKWRALCAFMGTALFFAIASALVSSPKAYEDMLRNGASYCINPQFGGLRGLLEYVHLPGFYPASAVGLALISAYFMRKLSFDKALALGIVAGVFLSPHCAWYDATVLVVPLAIIWKHLRGRTSWDTLFLISQPILWLCFGRVAEFVFFVLFLKGIEVRFNRAPILTRDAEPSTGA